MKIKSQTQMFHRGYLPGLFSNIGSITLYSFLLGMSFGFIPEHPNIIYGTAVIYIISTNLFYASLLKEGMTVMIKKPSEYNLMKHKILAPITIMLSVLTIVTCISGYLFMWKIYLLLVIISTLIMHIHKTRLGVK